MSALCRHLCSQNLEIYLALPADRAPNATSTPTPTPTPIGQCLLLYELIKFNFTAHFYFVHVPSDPPDWKSQRQPASDGRVPRDTTRTTFAECRLLGNVFIFVARHVASCRLSTPPHNHGRVPWHDTNCIRTSLLSLLLRATSNCHL